jgi:glyoxylase-like metal-dependent hydrolase (beta-lactamase superfamily II)
MVLRFVLLLLALAGCSARAEETPVTVAMHAVKVGAHSYLVQGLAGAASAANQGYMSNAGFVVTRNGVVVFDALASPALASKLLSVIRGITQQPIRRVIVSHYHADHYYGLQVFKALGAEIWAHKNARGVIDSAGAAERLQQRKEVLFPWVNDSTRLIAPDRYLDGDTNFTLGGVKFALRYVGPAHSDEDIVMWVEPDHVLYAGDVVFRGRVPFVGDADTRAWIGALDKLLALPARVLVPGHGAPSTQPRVDLAFTRDYLQFLRNSMSRAAQELIPFDEAYTHTDWSRYRDLPAFNEANRANAYNQYLRLEQETNAP